MRARARVPIRDVVADAGGFDRLVARCASSSSYVIGSTCAELVLQPAEQTFLLVGPSGSGKTTTVVSSAVLTAPGPLVCVSTKPDLYRKTHRARARLGEVLHFSPAGELTPEGASEVRWSPIEAASSANEARRIAKAMVLAEKRADVTDSTSAHFERLAGALIAAALFVAHHRRSGIESVREWVSTGDAAGSVWDWLTAVERVAAMIEAAPELGRCDASALVVALESFVTVATSANAHPVGRGLVAARAVLAEACLRDVVCDASSAGVRACELRPEVAAIRAYLGAMNQAGDRERGSIVTSSTNALEAYMSPAACAVTREPNFDPAWFVDAVERDQCPSLFITASERDQDATTALICGLLDQLFAVSFDRGRARSGRGARRSFPFTYFVLDECSNNARLYSLPSLLSQAGGLGVSVLCAFQSFTQIEAGWPRTARQFPDLFVSKMLLGGLSDGNTLDLFSKLAGEQWVDVPGESYDARHPYPIPGTRAVVYRPKRTTTTSRQRIPTLPPSELAKIGCGRALLWDGASPIELDLLSTAGSFTPAGFVPYEPNGSSRPPFWVSVLAGL